MTIDDYIAALPENRRKLAATLRAAITAAAPELTETIKYNMPTFQFGGAAILYFAIWKKHIGLYPIYRGSPAFEAALAPYRSKKDTVNFSFDQPLPIDLIAMIVKSQVNKAR